MPPAKRLSSVELLDIQIEFETTSSTIQDLCAKHKVTERQLRGHKGWCKRNMAIETLALPTTHNVVSEVVATDLVPGMLDSIKEFKHMVLDRALHEIRTNKYMEVKELREWTQIVDTIERSETKSGSDQQPINILVQNIMSKFKDDC